MLRFKFIGLIVFSLTFGYRDIPDIVTKVGTAAAPWLKIETGIRAVGMSGAHTAAGRGLSSVTYNPASLGYIEGQEIVFNKTNYLAGISHNIIGWQNVDIYQNLSITYLSSITKNKKIKKGIFKLPERNN